jgi:hypothetical protein
MKEFNSGAFESADVEESMGGSFVKARSVSAATMPPICSEHEVSNEMFEHDVETVSETVHVLPKYLQNVL